jgi:type IV pilus assembly protein PilW
VPALYRLGLVNGALRSEEIARGVEQFQVRYGLDSDDDGSVDEYVDAPPASDAVRWDQVIAARIWLLLRADCPETGYTNTNTYRMGNLVYPAAGLPDGYRRTLFTTTVALRN